ncbi:molybdopterin-binding protein [Streptomyces sp. V3I7]|uniref:TOBE domain-containing protein n=1 Tax=Streptomyces sp. V3I7 TaxID=3042278 RepID=UPI002789BFA5|nr:TOBE domain-containing protein [Streptomyces sp. V3I7]MDQ0989693.1 molybdate transport system regulatory protein [Streptomyces sp. V3I7]
MSLSIRNQLPGTVASVTEGEAMATVKVDLSDGQHITAAITLDAVKDLGLDTGSAVRALVKSTEVSLSTAPVQRISIRNQIPGTISDIAAGGAMATVKISIAAGGELTSAITKESVTDLGLSVGSSVVALIKSTEVSLETP